MPYKVATNVLSMDVVQLSNYVRKRFDLSHVGTETLDDIRDVSFRILSLKSELADNRREQLKIHYNLVQAYHSGYFTTKGLHSACLGFPYLYRYFIDGIPSLGIKGPSPGTLSSDQLLFDAGSCLSNAFFKGAVEHFSKLSTDEVTRFLTKEHQYDPNVRLNKLYIKLLFELLTKNALSQSAKSDIKMALERQVTTWNIEYKEGCNVDNLTDMLAVISGVGVRLPEMMPIINRMITDYRDLTPINVQLSMLFAVSSHVAHWGYDDMSTMLVDRLLDIMLHAYKKFDLKLSLLLMYCFGNIRFCENMFAHVLFKNVMPRMAKMRIEDMVHLLETFVNVNFSYSPIIKEFTVLHPLSSLTDTDRHVMAVLCDTLRYDGANVFKKNA